MPATLSPKYCCSPSQVCPGAGQEAFQARSLSADGAPHVRQHLFTQGTVASLMPTRGRVARGRAASLGPLRSFHPPVLGLAILEGQRGSPTHLGLPLLAVTSGLTPFLSSDILVCNGKQGVPFLGVLWD